MTASSWTEFWKEEKAAFFKIMLMSTRVFAQRFVKTFQIRSHHRILDFGCGPGFLLDDLIRHCPNVSGVEINDFFIAECKRKHPAVPCLKLLEGKDLQSQLSQSFGSSQFDFIVLLSVAQYFKGSRELQHTLKALSTFLTKDGKIILADIVTLETSSIRDLASIARQSVATGNSWNLLKFMLHLTSSSYRTISKRNKLQPYSPNEIQKISDQIGLSCSEVRNLTLHPTRMNFILQFS